MNPEAVRPSAAYQEFLDRGVFALPTCGRCGESHFSPRILCPHCGSTELTWRESTGEGTVYSTSTVFRRDREPCAVVLVDLDAGPRLMSNVIGTPAEEVRIGMRVRAEIGLREGQAVPLFRAVPR
ncbi:OB-fold domain-containing protein [Amycolatopsis sp. NPDC006131]|uniref:Zn-ribbon domain-containing OB-fold protein n=1 Tax=Amycolatopsis sp. NPDC006131 TaxID=3156731 RepID=UPI0033A725B9